MNYTFRKWVSKHIPIWGPLWTINPRAQLEAAYELTLTVVFATLPIWFFSLVSSFESFSTSPADSRSIEYFFSLYLSAIRTTVSNAELFMYVTSTLGPMLYLCLSAVNKNPKPIPWLRIQLVFAILITLAATVLFISVRNTSSTHDPFMIWLSFALYVFSLTLLFPTMAQDHARRSDATTVQREEQDDFLAGYNKHRGSR